MVRTGVPFLTWLEQPDGVIETAVELLSEKPDQPRQGWSG